MSLTTGTNSIEGHFTYVCTQACKSTKQYDCTYDVSVVSRSKVASLLYSNKYSMFPKINHYPLRHYHHYCLRRCSLPTTPKSPESAAAKIVHPSSYLVLRSSFLQPNRKLPLH